MGTKILFPWPIFKIFLKAIKAFEPIKKVLVVYLLRFLMKVVLKLMPWCQYNMQIYIVSLYIYSKTPIYRGVWGKGIIRGKSGSAVNRGFVWFTLCMFSPIWGEGNGRGISGFAVNRGAVYRGFTVVR